MRLTQTRPLRAGGVPIISHGARSRPHCRVPCSAAFYPSRAYSRRFDKRTGRQLANSVILPSAHSTKVFNCRPRRSCELAATIWILDRAGLPSGPAKPSPQFQRTLRREPNSPIPVGATPPAIALVVALLVAVSDPNNKLSAPPPPSSSPVSLPARIVETANLPTYRLANYIIPDACKSQMSSGLKPLLLPQLVEERKRHQQHDHDGEQTSLYYAYDSSSSDLASPSFTSTFSPTNHSRLSGSSSSLELTSPPGSDSPSSPTQSLHASKPSKSQLPDVQEEPLEREEEGPATPPKHNDREFGFHDYCLCRWPCRRNRPHRLLTS